MKRNFKLVILVTTICCNVFPQLDCATVREFREVVAAFRGGSNCDHVTMLMEKMNAVKQTQIIKNEVEASRVPALIHYDYLEMIDAPQKCEEKHSNFTIDYILGNDHKRQSHLDDEKVQYDWLSYTRYRPPKLQRLRKKECVQKRRLGRNPRIPFSSEQVTVLEEKFQISPYLSNADVMNLSKLLQLSESRIKIWFQNRRARERRDTHDVSRKGLNLIKSFLIKTRHSEAVPEDVQDLSVSAFRPCYNLLK